MSAAEKIDTQIRRFWRADLSEHGGWILKRLQAAFPHQTERFIANWLVGILHSNEHLFLYQDNAVALAQVVQTFTLDPKPIVQERFVWVQDPEDKAQLLSAALFYREFKRWAQSMLVERIIVCESSDVPPEIISKHLGRLFTIEMSYARL